MGESSHGTSEFYTLRSEISKRLIAEKGFQFIAVEGDWPPCFEVNRFIKGYDRTAPSSREVLQQFRRWPTWMWANEEVMALMDWIREYNTGAQTDRKVGFYGLDMYSLWESMDEIVQHLERVQAYGRDAQTYGLSATYMSEHCEDEVVAAMLELRRNVHAHAERDEDEGNLSLDLNAMVTVDAEKYYRAMFHFGPESWNIRDTNMTNALDTIMAHYGSDAKCIVWAHNTHVGDARFTDMATEGMTNIGQMLRERHGESVYVVGFGTHSGKVIAGGSWGAPLQEMSVPRGRVGSWEDIVHRAGSFDQMIFFREKEKWPADYIGHRAIGVVYDPTDEYGNYVLTVMAGRYDAFIFVNQTRALRPIRIVPVGV